MTTKTLALLGATLAAPALGQDPLHTFQGAAASDWFGSFVRVAGDVDGDGIDDLIIGASQNLTGFHGPHPGYARVFSGADLSLIHEWSGHGTKWTDGPDDHFGQSVDGAGDVDGDGFADLIVGAYKDDDAGQNSGEVFVFSGADGSLIHNIDGDDAGDRFGYAVSGLGDVDVDGFADFLVGIYKDDDAAVNSGSARVYSGASGAALYTVYGEEVNDGLGWSVDDLGDVDGDGVPDFVVGAFRFAQRRGLGYARVHSGADGALLFRVTGDAPRDHFGWAVAGLGDLDGDGKPEFAVGASQAAYGGLGTGNGYVRVYSGADGAQLFEVRGLYPGDGFGAALDDAGDVDGDGVRDLIVGAPRYGDPGGLGIPGYARVFSGADGREIQRLFGNAPGDLFGFSVAGGFDFDANGYGDVLVGAPEDFLSGAGTGYVVLHSGMCNPPPERYCVAAPNSVGSGAPIDFQGALSLAVDDFTLTASGLPVHHFGVFYFGPGGVQHPFGDGYRCVSAPIQRLPPVQSIPGGTISQPFDFGAFEGTSSEITPGSRWCFQLWYRDPLAMQSGFNLTDGLHVTFCP